MSEAEKIYPPIVDLIASAILMDRHNLSRGQHDQFNRGLVGYRNLAPHIPGVIQSQLDRQNGAIHILDLGCGTGRAGYDIEAAYPGVHVTGVNLLKIPPRKYPVLPDSQLIIGSARDLPADAQFNVVLAIMSITNSSTQDAEGMRILQEHLAPGGHFTIVDVPIALMPDKKTFALEMWAKKEGYIVAPYQSPYLVLGMPLYVSTIERPL